MWARSTGPKTTHTARGDSCTQHSGPPPFFSHPWFSFRVLFCRSTTGEKAFHAGDVPPEKAAAKRGCLAWKRRGRLGHGAIRPEGREWNRSTDTGEPLCLRRQRQLSAYDAPVYRYNFRAEVLPEPTPVYVPKPSHLEFDRRAFLERQSNGRIPADSHRVARRPAARCMEIPVHPAIDPDARVAQQQMKDQQRRAAQQRAQQRAAKTRAESARRRNPALVGEIRDRVDEFDYDAYTAALRSQAGKTREQRVVEDVARRTRAELKKHHQTLGACFRNMDKNADNHVSLDEMKRGFESEAHVSLTENEARALFAAFDTDGSGSVDLREMLTKFKLLDRSSGGGAQAGLDTGRASDGARAPVPFAALVAGKEPWNNSTFLGDWGTVGNGQSGGRPGSSAGTAAAGGGLSVPPLVLAMQQQERAETPWSRNSRRHNARLAAFSRGGRRRNDGKPVYRTPAQRQSDANAAMRIEKRRRAELRMKQSDPNFDVHAARWPDNATRAPFVAVPESAPAAGWYSTLKNTAHADTGGHLTARGVGETVSARVGRPPAPPRAASAGRTRGPRSGGRSAPSVVYKGLTPPLY